MKGLVIAIALLLSLASPGLAGYTPSKSGGPSTTQGSGTR